MSAPYGTCQCGCGRTTAIAPETDKRYGWVKGEPRRFVLGHGTRSAAVEYLEQDCGFATPCWVWQLGKSDTGYGHKRNPSDKRMHLAHRTYYEQHVGPIPEGMQVDHLCRNRACVNPAHLEAVTPAENTRRGLKAKLTEADVAAIRESCEGHTVIARRYGVDPLHIWRIRTGRNWAPEDRQAA